jgi:hypothetical protein
VARGVDRRRTRSRVCAQHEECVRGKAKVTYLNNALSSVKPSASASTAAGVPMSRRANMARYRSNSDRDLLSSCSRRPGTLASGFSCVTAFCLMKPEYDGAGSTEVNFLR